MSIRRRAWSLAMTMLTGWVALSVAAHAEQAAESTDVSKTLSDTKMQAFQLMEDATQMQLFTQSNDSWESQADAVNKIKEDVNAMSRLLGKLQQGRATAASSQQLAIDRITPVAKELAANTTAAIERINKNPKRLNTPAYQEYIAAFAQSAANLSSTIIDLIDYETAKQRLEHLAAGLDVTAGT